MCTEFIDTVIVGAGQAGLAMSEHLSEKNVNHVLLERQRIVERWRSERWDSLVANGPAWHDRFPTREFTGISPEAFATKQQVIEYFEAYAEQIGAPIRTQVNVHSVRRKPSSQRFVVSTSNGNIECRRIIAATGAFQVPLYPDIITKQPDIDQLHSCHYKNPEALARGAVLVIGAGSSGSQIADELARSGKKVFLSVGPHDRPPRRYRGHDFVWWLGVLGKWDAAAASPGTEHVTIAVSGAHGGNTVDFRKLAERGVTLVGRTKFAEHGSIHFANDLAATIQQGDANYLSVLDEADAYIASQGLNLPPEPEARKFPAAPHCITHPIQTLDIQQANITTVIWATGYGQRYDWLQVDVFNEQGQPIHQRGVTQEPGVYFLGLPWQSRRGSSFIWGVWHDAKYLADHIAIQHAYFEHHQRSSTSIISKAT